MNDVTENLEYKKYIVAHIDILAAKDMMIDEKESTKFLNALNKMYFSAQNSIDLLSETVRKEFNSSKDNFECSDFNIQTKIFSDNICIYLECPNSDKYLLYIAWFLQMIAYYQYYSLMEYEILVRGAVNIGDFYANDIFVIGSALSSVYELESKKAVSPRILIGEEFRKSFFEVLKRYDIPFTRKDFDGTLFIDYLIYTNQKDKDPKDFLMKHREILIKKFRNAKEYNHKLKILLAMIYHNRYCINSNEWDVANKTGAYIASINGTRNCIIEIEEFVIEIASSFP